MSGFSSRISGATDFERYVLGLLQREGWTAQSFGQALLTPEMRELLRQYPTAVRWLPDIVAGKLGAIVYVDCKASQPHARTNCHSVETRSSNTMVSWQRFSGHPVVYAFPHGDQRVGYTAASTWTVHKQPRSWLGSGSGTPFDVVECGAPGTCEPSIVDALGAAAVLRERDAS